MGQGVGAIRLIAAIASATAVVVTAHGSLDAGRFVLVNFFGCFTVQGNLICVAVFAAAGIAGLTGGRQGTVLVFARAAATVYIVIVGLVYNTLLTGVDVGTVVPWTNAVLHVVLPVYAAVDWLVVGDRPALRWSRLPLVLGYPIVWVAVVLLRQVAEGAGGWVPYPFLNLARLGAGVWFWVAVIAVAFVLVGALVWWASRWRGIIRAR
ncbi:Pr6Pr family membrane protein [Galbitalea sp. SE-J8]|uniref:Pr6Pr family membrane protein n=1 Tax=Galbitalea sp. SE-J8 TaxID=3054952 RepID=UPI00259D28A0|nr:Pr6Pr family membrane protein [Galbitalea sp. SE-J8]MDM4762470.1 Pr6Pr family membrane protein [Galbitalea sp. SE-J8]